MVPRPGKYDCDISFLLLYATLIDELHPQQVAHALSEFVTELLPASSTVSQCRSLLEYLFNIVRSMQTPHIGNPRFEPLFSFLRRFVHSYGEGIDKTTCATLKGFVVAPLDLELCQAFETLLLSTLSKARTVFGDTWFQPSKARQPKDTGETPAALQDYNEALASFFAVLQECIETCPNFLLSLQIVSTKQNSYSLLHQSIEVAAASLYDSDPDVGRHAMRLLTAVVREAGSCLRLRLKLKSHLLFPLLSFSCIVPIETNLFDHC